MSEEFIGGTGQETGGEQIVENVESQVEETTEQQSPTISVAEAMKLKEENARLKEYAEFIKNTGAGVQRPEPPKFEMAPTEIPYVEDVDKLVEAKLYKFKEEQYQEYLVNDLKNTAEQMRASDPDFDRRMDLAAEYLERDEFAQSKFDKARTAKEKIAILESIAKWHPMYNQTTVKTTADDIAKKLQENSQIPATLSNLQTAGNGQKAVTQMTDDEYQAFFKTITKGY